MVKKKALSAIINENKRDLAKIATILTGSTLSKFVSSLGNAPWMLAAMPQNVVKGMTDKFSILRSEVGGYRFFAHPRSARIYYPRTIFAHTHTRTYPCFACSGRLPC
jgi:hypothetical protein